MASKKFRDIIVKVGEYTDRNTGETKSRFKNVGALMQNEDDRGEVSFFIMLERTFNPAGVPGNDDRESVLLSCYVPKEQREQQQQDRSGGDYAGASGGERRPSPSQQAARTSHQAPYNHNDMDDEIPF